MGAEANGGKLTYQTCTKAQMEVAAEEILSQKKVVEGLKSKYPGLSFHRIPVCNSGSPTDADYGLLTGALTGTKFNAPVVINCQVGLSRSTTGGVIACLFREYQVSPYCRQDQTRQQNHFISGQKLLLWSSANRPGPQPGPAEDGHIPDGHGE